MMNNKTMLWKKSALYLIGLLFAMFSNVVFAITDATDVSPPLIANMTNMTSPFSVTYFFLPRQPIAVNNCVGDRMRTFGAYPYYPSYPYIAVPIDGTYWVRGYARICNEDNAAPTKWWVEVYNLLAPNDVPLVSGWRTMMPFNTLGSAADPNADPSNVFYFNQQVGLKKGGLYIIRIYQEVPARSVMFIDGSLSIYMCPFKDSYGANCVW